MYRTANSCTQFSPIKLWYLRALGMRRLALSLACRVVYLFVYLHVYLLITLTCVYGRVQKDVKIKRAEIKFMRRTVRYSLLDHRRSEDC